MGDDVVVVEPSAPGLALTSRANLDPTRRSVSARATDVALGADNVIAGAATRALALARTLGAAEAVGGMAACVDSAVAYAQERVQFGRTIGTFQAIKHHCANMLVAAELATAVVWDAARSAHDDADEFALTAAHGRHPGLCALRPQRPDEHPGARGDRLHLGARCPSVPAPGLGPERVAGQPQGRRGRDRPDRPGVSRGVSLDLPPEAEAIRAGVRAEIATFAHLDGDEQRKALLDTGLMVPHWPVPWGRAAGAVEQLVIDEELKRAGVRVPPLGITGWNIMTVNQYATPDQVQRWVEKTLMGEYVWCQLFSEPDAGSDAAAVKTRGTRVEGGWVVNGQKVWTSDAQQQRPRFGHGAHQSRCAQARRHHHHGDRYARRGRRGAPPAPDHRQLRLQRGVLQRCLRARRRRGGHARRRMEGGPLDVGQ